MIICVCNNLSEHQIEDACSCAKHADEVYGCLNCEPRCAICVPDVEEIFNRVYNSINEN